MGSVSPSEERYFSKTTVTNFATTLWNFTPSLLTITPHFIARRLSAMSVTPLMFSTVYSTMKVIWSWKNITLIP